MNIQYRWADHSDYIELGEVMFVAVREGRSLYNEQQRTAWVTSPRIGAEWDERLSQQNIALAISKGTIVGFMSLSEQGYLDLAYIRPEHQGTGIFRRLFNMINSLAVSQDQGRIWTHASLMAQPAFEAIGFETLSEESVSLNGQKFDRFVMQLKIAT